MDRHMDCQAEGNTEREKQTHWTNRNEIKEAQSAYEWHCLPQILFHFPLINEKYEVVGAYLYKIIIAL